MNARKLSQVPAQSLAGFTLIELVTIVAIVTVIGTLVLPALALTKPASQSIQCMKNLHDLMRALHMYAADFDGFLPPNIDDGNTIPGHNWCSGGAGKGAPSEFNPDSLNDPAHSMLVPYGADHTAFKCPADLRVGIYQGTNASLKGTKVPAARSLSMSQAVGTDPNRPSNGKLSVNGPWLDNNHSNTRAGRWQLYGKMSDFSNPGPARTFVLIDEDSRSINDGGIAVGVVNPEWIDLPASYHNRAAGVSFADGHAEIHGWVDPRTIDTRPSFSRLQVPGSLDWKWLADRTTALK